MLFQVEMDVNIPHGLDPDFVTSIKNKEKHIAQALQKSGKWRHLWRVVGQYKNISIFDVESADELHDILTSLPLFPFMQIEVTSLCRHPSSVRDDDR
jgi:muconolactone D-isomerase